MKQTLTKIKILFCVTITIFSFTCFQGQNILTAEMINKINASEK